MFFGQRRMLPVELISTLENDKETSRVIANSIMAILKK